MSTILRKQFKQRYRGIHSNWKKKLLNQSNLVLIAIESGCITVNQLNAIKKDVSKKLKKVGKVHFLLKPNKSITKKQGVRMGKGKGNISYSIVNVKAGKMIVELKGIPTSQAYYILRSIDLKLSLKTKIIQNDL
jgi:ribosomal protein L16